MIDWKPLVSEFIAAEIKKPFVWGVTDCASTADRWVTGVRGSSPLLTFGRVHKDEQEAREWLSSPGGISVAVNRVCRAYGLQKTKQPQAGDVGLAINGMKLCVAIHAGPFWFSRDADGMIGVPLASVWKAWKVV